MLRSHQSCSLVCLLMSPPTLLLMGEQLPWQLCTLVFHRLQHGVWGNLLFALFCCICCKLELTFGQFFSNISRMGPLSIWVWAPQPSSLVGGFFHGLWSWWLLFGCSNLIYVLKTSSAHLLSRPLRIWLCSSPRLRRSPL